MAGKHSGRRCSAEFSGLCQSQRMPDEGAWRRKTSTPLKEPFISFTKYTGNLAYDDCLEIKLTRLQERQWLWEKKCSVKC